MNIAIATSIHGSFEGMLKKVGSYDRLTIRYIIREFSKAFPSVMVFSHDKKSYELKMPEGVQHKFCGSQLKYALFGWVWLCCNIRRHDIKAVWLSSGGALFSAFMVNKLTKAKVILQYDHTLYSTTNNSWKRAFFKALERLLLNFVDYFVVTTEKTREFVGNKGYILPNVKKGIDTDLYNPSKVKKHDFYKKIKGPVILFVGRMEEEKDPMTLSMAFLKVKTLIPDVSLVICGEGSLSMEGDGVYSLGKVKDIPGMLKGADIFVIPSIRDPTPKSLLEAMSMGKACIGSNIAGIRDFIGKDEECGMLFEPGNADHLANCLEFLMGHSTSCYALGQKARKRVLDQYDIKKNIALEIEFIKGVVENGE